VSEHFRASLADLMARLDSGSRRYVRCVKSNHQKEAWRLDPAVVREQLSALGILAAVTVRQQGYPHRCTHAAFVRRYGGLLPRPDRAQLSAADFVNRVLLATLQSRHIAVGANFRFGRGREGDTHTLKRLAAAAGVKVSVVPILEDEEGRMSSSRIRAALSAGELQRAATLLNRAYRFQGEVVGGRGLGRGLGWPTANLQVDGRKFLPGLGVYAAWAWVDDHGTRLPAVMNLGPQPTVDPGSPSAVEVHLLDVVKELVGRSIKVEPVRRLRGQQRFSGLEELSAQISRDADEARAILLNQAG